MVVAPVAGAAGLSPVVVPLAGEVVWPTVVVIVLLFEAAGTTVVVVLDGEAIGRVVFVDTAVLVPGVAPWLTVVVEVVGVVIVVVVLLLETPFKFDLGVLAELLVIVVSVPNEFIAVPPLAGGFKGAA